MNKNYDVIIIGAGLGGLTAASILVKSQKRVLVIEKNPVPGGYAVNFRRGKFEFDAGLHLMYGCNKNGNTYNILKQCGIVNDIKFLKPKYLYRAIFPKFDFRVSQCDIKGYIRLLQQMFPSEKSGIEHLFAEIKKIYDGIYRFDRQKNLSSEFIFSINTTCDKLLDKYLNHSELKAIIFQLWPFFGLPSHKLPVFYFCYPWYDFFKEGGFYPLGGAKTISNALSKAIIGNYGDILYGREVKKIVIRNGEAKSVIVDEGEEFVGKNIVSNIDIYHTFKNLIGDGKIPSEFLSKLNILEPSISAFQVYLGLNLDLKKIGFLDYEVFVNPCFDLEKQFRDSMESNVDNAPYSITCYSNLDESGVPKNKAIIVITMFSGYDIWEKLSKKEYKEKKAVMAKKLIRRAEDILPDLSSYIEVQEIATPITMERYTGNYKGAIYGWAPSISQTGFRRMDFKTPIKNLYLVGAWTRPGGGTTGVMYSGKSVASQILANN